MTMTSTAADDLDVWDSLTRREFVLWGSAAAALLLGCSDGDGDEEAGGGGRHDVEDVFGTVSVPVDPQRVVALDDQVFGTLLRLGFPAERIVGWARGETPVELYPYLADLADLEAFENLGGAFDDPNIEAILAAEPDLILMVGMDGEDFYVPIFDKLRGTGIPVFGAFNGYLTLDEYLRLLRDVGVAVGRAEEAGELEAGFRARVDALAARLDERGGRPSAAFLRVTPEGQYFNAVMPLLDALGLPGERATPEEFNVEVSAEQLEQFDHDVLFVSDGDDPAGTLATLEANPLWATLPAVRTGRAHLVPEMVWGIGYSLPALDSMMSDLEAALD